MCATSAEKSQAFADGLANASGSAKEQAETMLDNLPGKITLMQSAAEGFGLAVYEGMEEPLKGVVEQATGYLGDLQKAFEDNGISGVIEELGTIFADVTNQISEFLPQATQMAVGFFNNFVDGIVSAIPSLIPSLIESGENLIYGLLDGIVNTFVSLSKISTDIVIQLTDGIISATPIISESAITIIPKISKSLIENAPRIAKAGLDIVSELVGSITAVMPEKLGNPIKESFETIRKSLTNGGLKKAISTVATLFGNIANVVIELSVNVLPILVDIIDFLG